MATQLLLHRTLSSMHLSSTDQRRDACRHDEPCAVVAASPASAPSSTATIVERGVVCEVPLDAQRVAASSPWSYGAMDGDDCWRPPPGARLSDATSADFLKRCAFCRRSLERADAFMYRGDKAFCCLECRQHHMIVHTRKAWLHLTGRRFSMVPLTG
ncbi:unnamed protein product [Closterium sp. Naga37s-1]|nr:unnamed protein product [Closterium sp. Naga37s-1]